MSETNGKLHVLRRSQSVSSSAGDPKPSVCVRYTRSVNLSVVEGQQKRYERSKHTVLYYMLVLGSHFDR